MEIARYTQLIRQMPYEDQAFETQMATWKHFENHKLFRSFYRQTFEKNETVSISRGDLFAIAKTDPYKAMFSIVLWGYPRGYTRGNNMKLLFPLFLEQVQYLSGRLQNQESITLDEVKQMLKTCKGVGLSTLSKLLYFFNIKVDGYRSLIMDARIISVLSNGRFAELNSLAGIREHNKEEFYSEYLKLCTQLSKTNGYKQDQLELFLFIFGNNLNNRCNHG